MQCFCIKLTYHNTYSKKNYFNNNTILYIIYIMKYSWCYTLTGSSSLRIIYGIQQYIIQFKFNTYRTTE